MEVETKDLNGYTIKIMSDDNPDSPRNWDNLGLMVCFHNRYDLGDSHDFTDGGEYAWTLDRWGNEDCKIIDSWDTLADAIEHENGKGMLLPLRLYDHSGISMSTSANYPFNCPWDSGQVGWIFISDKKIRSEFGCKRISKQRRAQIQQYLINEVETYNDYLTGSVYGYEVITPDGESLDSCWGFYGYDHDKSGLMEYVTSAIEHHEQTPAYIHSGLHNQLQAAGVGI